MKERHLKKDIESEMDRGYGVLLSNNNNNNNNKVYLNCKIANNI